MNILFIGKACPLKTAQDILQSSGKNPGYQIIKFMDLILKGFCANKQKVSVITNISNPNNRYTSAKIEEHAGIYYHYLPTIRIPIFSQLLHTCYAFIYTFHWYIKTSGDRIIVCDIFASSSSSSGCLLAAKIFGIKTCLLLTDMIMIPVTTSLNTKKWWWKSFLQLRIRNQQRGIRKYDSFIFLTKQMNNIYNPLKKPYIIMEGSVDHSFIPNKNIIKTKPRIVLYAGAIEAEYGFNELVQAFMTLSQPHLELHIYGSGKFVQRLLEYQAKDSRIKYMGIVSNEQIVEAEQRATLLVNPRLSHHEFAKYSFPSKTTEYMLSGTPLLTTKLPGIPYEYFDYLYTFEEENIEGFAKKMHEVLSLPSSELEKKGEAAHNFVLKNKNNIIQTKHLIDFFSKLINPV